MCDNSELSFWNFNGDSIFPSFTMVHDLFFCNKYWFANRSQFHPLPWTHLWIYSVRDRIWNYSQISIYSKIVCYLQHWKITNTRLTSIVKNLAAWFWVVTHETFPRSVQVGSKFNPLPVSGIELGFILKLVFTPKKSPISNIGKS